MKLISWVLGTLISLAVVVGFVAKVDSRHTGEALAGEVAEDLKRHVIEQRMAAIQERLWSMEDRWAARFEAAKDRIHQTLHELIMFMTKEARETYRDLMDEYEDLEAELEPKKKADDDE